MNKIRRFIRRLFLQQVKFTHSMAQGQVIQNGYLLGYTAIPSYKYDSAKKVLLVDSVTYMAVIEPHNPELISSGRYEYRHIIVPSNLIQIL